MNDPSISNSMSGTDNNSKLKGTLTVSTNKQTSHLLNADCSLEV